MLGSSGAAQKDEQEGPVCLHGIMLSIRLEASYMHIHTLTSNVQLCVTALHLSFTFKAMHYLHLCLYTGWGIMFFPNLHCDIDLTQHDRIGYFHDFVFDCD